MTGSSCRISWLFGLPSLCLDTDFLKFFKMSHPFFLNIILRLISAVCIVGLPLLLETTGQKKEVDPELYFSSASEGGASLLFTLCRRPYICLNPDAFYIFTRITLFFAKEAAGIKISSSIHMCQYKPYLIIWYTRKKNQQKNSNLIVWLFEILTNDSRCSSQVHFRATFIPFFLQIH